MSFSGQISAPDIGGYQAPDVLCNELTDDRVRRLLANDPVIGGLVIWEIREEWINADGGDNIIRRALSGSRYLRKLELEGFDDNTDHDLRTFFTWLAENRSIEHLVIKDLSTIDDQDRHPDDDEEEEDDEIDMFEILAPFFKHNTNLRSIEVENSLFALRHGTIPSLISALTKTNRLERIVLDLNNIEDETVACLISSLTPMSNLLELGLRGSFGRKACKALGVLLSTSSSKVHTLDIKSDIIDDKCIQILTSALIKNKTIMVLHLGFRDLVTSVGWSLFTSYLSNPDCSLQKIVLAPGKTSDRDITALVNKLAISNTSVRLDLTIQSNTSLGWLGISTGLKSPNSALVRLDFYGCDIDNEGAVLIAVALSGNTVLKSLDLRWNRSVTPAGWVRFFQLLLDSGFNSCLDELALCLTKIDDEGSALLAEWLVTKTSMKKIDLSSCVTITASGWAKCVGVLASSDLVLESLALSGAKIDDVGGAMLIELLAKTSTLISLDLRNTSITTNGLSAFADVLRRPSLSSNLKVLELNRCNATDVICDLATALAHNSTLEVLDVIATGITDQGLKAMESALCDISSIGAIYNSNHTLHTLSNAHFYPFDDTLVEHLLETNYNKNKIEVARSKILQFYLSDVNTIRPTFDGLAVSVLPIAIAWLGRDRRGFSTLYHLLQVMPSLYSHSDPEDNCK